MSRRGASIRRHVDRDGLFAERLVPRMQQVMAGRMPAMENVPSLAVTAKNGESTTRIEAVHPLVARVAAKLDQSRFRQSHRIRALRWEVDALKSVSEPR